jgi:IS605 OrfB family transposase
MIRSARLSTKFMNHGRAQALHVFLAEYRRVCRAFIDILWDMDSVPALLPKELTTQVSSWLSARMMQAAGKQASGIVRGTQQKQRQRLFMIRKLQGLGENPARLQRAYDKAKISKPNPSEIEPELDSRFIAIDQENQTSFDLWLCIGSIGDKMKIQIPLRKTKALNRWASLGAMRPGARITNGSVTLMFDIESPEPRKSGKTLGLDVGEKNTFTVSDGQTSRSLDNWDLSTINQKLSRKKKGSRGFEKAQEHRKNYINWTLNQLNLSGAKELRIEDIKNMRKYKRTSRRLSHWTYTQIFGKLERLCEESGVQITRISPTYTSQRCSECGWTRKKNRKGKTFCCSRCGFRTDADLNASRNLSFELPRISSAIRRKRLNRDGFFWKPDGLFSDGGEPIVPLVQGT